MSKGNDVTVRLHPVIGWLIIVSNPENGNCKTKVFPIVYREGAEDSIPIPERVDKVQIVPSWPSTFLAEAIIGNETANLGIHTSPDVEALRKKAIQLMEKGSKAVVRRDGERVRIVSGWFQSKYQSELLNLKKGWRIRGLVKTTPPESKTLFNIELIKRVERRKDASHLRSGVFTAYQKSRIEEILLSQRKIEPGEVDILIPYDGIYRIAITPDAKTTYFIELFVEKRS